MVKSSKKRKSNSLHKSFRLTKRRDSFRPLKLQKLMSFTIKVNRTVWQYKKELLTIALVYVILMYVFVGLSSQESYQSFADSIDEQASDLFSGFGGQVLRAMVLFFTAFVGGLNGDLSVAQQLYMALIIVFGWLSIVWFLRNRLAGHRIKVRDAFYNSGAPIAATVVVLTVVAFQLLPIGLAALGYSAASQSGLLDGGIESMTFWIAVVLLTVLSLYWLTSSFFALIIVTIPGTYPFKALGIARDMVLGRRLKIVGRLVWMLVMTIVYWGVVLVPIILLDSLLNYLWSWFGNVPLVPITIMILSGFSIIWVSTYIYLFYRQVIDEDVKYAKVER